MLKGIFTAGLATVGYWLWRGGRADTAEEAALARRADSKPTPDRVVHAFTSTGFAIAAPSGGFDVDRALAEFGLQRIPAAPPPPPPSTPARDDVIARALELLRRRS